MTRTCPGLQEAPGRGHRVEPQVGFPGHRIDPAVVHPRDEDRYLLGIEYDGATFHSAKSVKGQDVMRQNSRRGRITERIWSRNWWKSSKRETDRIDAGIS